MHLENVLKKLVRELIIELLRHYSPTGHEDEAVGVLKDFCLNKLSFDEVRVDSVGNLIARKGSGKYIIAFLGHIDTVSGEVPFKVSNEVFHGRGAVDAKGPLASAFVAASLADVGDATVYAIAAVGEEGDSRGANYLVNSGFRADAVVICEPTKCNGVVIEYRGSVNIEVKCTSEAVHTAVAHLVTTACDKIINAWVRVKELLSKLGVSPVLIRLLCGKGTNVTPTEAYGLINVRVPYGVDLSSIEQVIKGSLPNGCTYNISSYIPPIKVSPNSLSVRAMVRSLINLGIKPRLVRKLGTSDMNVIYGRVSNDVLAYGPGDPKLAHTNYERVSINELLLASKAYMNFISEYLRLRSSKK